MSRRGRIQFHFTGAGLFLVLGAVLFLFGVFFALADLLSPDVVTWTGRCIPATERGGIAYYAVNGKTEAVNDPNEPATAPTHTVTVCYDPVHPEQGMVLVPAAHVLETVEIAAPIVLALIVLTYGVVIRPMRFKDMDEALPLTRRP